MSAVLDQDRLNRFLQERFPSHAPGAAVGILLGEDRYASGFGLASLDPKRPFTPHSLFRACSITKQFLALVLLQLEAEGKLSLDDHPGRYVPSLQRFDPRLQLRHLAQNRSGLLDYWCAAMLTGARAESRFSLEQGARLIQSLPRQMFTPGQGTRYNNGNWRILQWVVEAASGQTLAELLHSRIFAPLDMQASALAEDTSLPLPDGTTGYRRTQDGWEREITRIVWSGDAALVSTLEDLLKWESAMLHPDPRRLPAADRLAQPLPHPDGSPGSYGFGLNAWRSKGRRMHWHGGALRGWRMAHLRFPDDDAAVVVMLNRTSNPVPHALAIAKHIGLAPAWDKPVPGAPGEAASLLGSHYCAQHDLVAEIIETEAGLGLSLGMDTSPLVWTAPYALSSQDGFQRIDPGSDGFTLHSRNLGFEGEFVRVAAGEGRTAAAGRRFHCAELASAMQFNAEGNSLHFDGPHGTSEDYGVRSLGEKLLAFDCLRALDEQPPGRFALRWDGEDLVVGCLLAQGFRFTANP